MQFSAFLTCPIIATKNIFQPRLIRCLGPTINVITFPTDDNYWIKIGEILFSIRFDIPTQNTKTKF